jgi:hypothetical protein
MTTYQTNLNSAEYRLSQSRPALTLLDELLAAWWVHFRNCRYTAAREVWSKIEAARREA